MAIFYKLIFFYTLNAFFSANIMGGVITVQINISKSELLDDYGGDKFPSNR